MARPLIKSGIEQFVEAYIKKLRNTTNKRSVKPFIEKASSILEVFIDRPCCTDVNFTVEYARRNNSLTDFITRELSISFDRRKYKKSLIRAKVLLDNYLSDPCCV